MKVMKALKSLAVVALLSLSVPGLNFSSAANASTRISQNIRYDGELISYSYGGEYRVASALSNCRRINTNGGRLNVRRSPNLMGSVVGKLSDGTRVSILDRGENGWVPIASPVRGYISARYLTYCR